MARYTTIYVRMDGFLDGKILAQMTAPGLYVIAGSTHASESIMCSEYREIVRRIGVIEGQHISFVAVRFLFEADTTFQFPPLDAVYSD